MVPELMQPTRTIIRAVCLAMLAMMVTTAAYAQVPTRPFAPVQGGPADQATELSLYREGRLMVQFQPRAAEIVELRETQPGKASGPVVTGIPSVDAKIASMDLRSIQRTLANTSNPRAKSLGMDRWFSLDFGSHADMEALAVQMRTDANVENASPDYRYFPAAVPNDTQYATQWGHNNTGQMLDYCWGCGGHPAGSPVGTPGFDSNAETAWNAAAGYGSSSVTIAILDTGVDTAHADLLANLVAGWDYGDGDSNPFDNSAIAGHGTACAGVAAAVADNALGVAGIAGGCSIMPLKVADSGGSLFSSYISNALIHAADNGADIASMSFGSGATSDPVMDPSIVYADAAGVVMLAATGNENFSQIGHPSIHADVIAIGAASNCGDRKRSSSNAGEVNPGVSTDPNGYTCDGERWWGSNYGSAVQDAASAVDVIAPTILPTTDISGGAGYTATDYNTWFNGTSCSTPYAAGVAALILSNNPGLTSAQVRNVLRTTAIDIVNVESGAGWDRYTGYGMVDAAAAVGGTPTNPPVISVSPGSMSFTVGINGSDSDILTISNVGTSPADDLNWTITDQDPVGPAPALPEFRMQKASQRIDLPFPGEWKGERRTFEPVDPNSSPLRQCTDCRTANKGAGPGEEDPLAFANSVTDGGFEAGSGSGNWTETSTNFGTPLCTLAGCGAGGGSGPRTGVWWCWFGGIAAVEIGSVSQSVTIPSGSGVTLDFYMEIPACDSGADFMEVLIDGNQEFLVTGSDATCGVIGYQAYQVDLSAYADGGSHTLTFRSEIFASGGTGSNFFVDDISINQAIPDCTWLSASPAAGTTSDGGSSNVTVSVDATGLAVGVYNCELIVDSNDATNPSVTVPVQLTVTNPNVDVLVSTAASNPVSLYSLPDGSGDPLTAAQDWDGVVGSTPTYVDATISVTLTQGGSPVVGHPAADIQLVAQSGGWTLCAGTNEADGPTDGTGTATFTGPLFAGGSSGPGELLQVVVSGVTLGTVTYAGGGAGLDIRINGGDIVDDKIVNLADVGFFSTDFLGYDYRSDFVWNGIINLGEVGIMAIALGAVCPVVPKDQVASTLDSANGTLGLYFDAQGSTRVTALPVDQVTTAYLLLSGPTARSGITAWETQFAHSSNVVIHDVKLPARSLNLGEGQEFVVGTGGLVKAKGDQPLLLATVRLSVTDASPANLSLLAGRSSDVLPALSDGEGVYTVGLTSGAGQPVAFLNDEHAIDVAGVAMRGLNLHNVPNPFNPSTQIHFNLPRDGKAEVRIYDVSGRQVTALGGGRLTAGEHQFNWNGRDHNGAGVVSGIYFYKLYLNGQSLGSAKKMSLLK